MTKTNVANIKETAIAHNYGDMAGSGFEDTQGSDLSIPFINLLQSNSPEVEEDGVKGAKPGMLLNSVTKELFDEIIFLPVHKEEAWVEWVPRTRGGGFVGLHDPKGEVVQGIISQNGGSRIPAKSQDGKRIPFTLKNGNELVETYYMYGLILDEDGKTMESFAVISFSSTKIKPYRDWLTSMYLIKGKPPIFANRARVQTVKQKNESGSYSNFSVDPFKNTWTNSLIDPVEEKDLLEEAKNFRNMVLSGVARADFNQQQTVENSEEIPF